MSYSMRSIDESRRAEAGFTLIEVLIAIVVLVFGLIAVTNLFLVAGSSNTVANQATAAADVAGQVLENLKAQPFNSTQLTATTGTFPAATPQRTDNIPGVGVINTWWSITDIEPAPQTRTKFIRVRSEGAGLLARGRSRAEFTTYRACTIPTAGCP
jgi:prepilin-type N-terminal cleavage/methylation domain-containing protein